MAMLVITRGYPLKLIAKFQGSHVLRHGISVPSWCRGAGSGGSGARLVSRGRLRQRRALRFGHFPRGSDCHDAESIGHVEITWDKHKPQVEAMLDVPKRNQSYAMENRKITVDPSYVMEKNTI